MAIVFFDIDQTLAIGTWIPDSARKGLSLLRENGHKVFLCTGRNVSYARKHFGDLADGFITNNGTLAYYDGDFIYDRPMDHELVQTIVEILKECEAGYAFHSKRQGYYGGPEELYDTVAVVGDEGYLLKGLKEEESYYSFDVGFYDVRQRELIRERLKDCCIMNPHGPHPSADMTTFASDKAKALTSVIQHLGYPKEDSYAFGDGINDITMMKAAGHGIAMGNGQEKTREAAEYVTAPIDEDGVWLALKHYKLI